MRVELVAVDAPRRFADVDAQVGRTLDDTTARRSVATGDCSAMTLKQRSSSSSARASYSSSPRMRYSAASRSIASSTSVARGTSSVTPADIRAIPVWISSSCWWNSERSSVISRTSP
jgi:hypothetical protein